jgi:fructose-bisphosphate aldolase class II
VSLATTGDLVASAASAGSAVLAFNVITIEHAEGVADGVELAGVAAVLQISENTVRFHGGRGATSIMVDAAHLPYRDNVDRTRTFAKRAHAAGLWVEAELGEIGGKAGQKKDAHALGARTDPDEAEACAEETGVDGLAVAVGNSHAMTTRDAHLDLELCRAVAAPLPERAAR